MSVGRDADGTIRLEGVCTLEDADVLLQKLLERPESVIEWSGCDALHASVIQVLLRSRSTLAGQPRGLFLRNFIAPLLCRPTD